MTDGIEEWRPVVGWEGKYEVSRTGHVRSLSRFVEYNDGRKPVWTPGRELKQNPQLAGHLLVKLTLHNRTYNRLAHRLVMEAFVGPRPAPSYDIRHLNGNPADNRLENLAYGTKSENQQDTIRHGRNANINKTHCPNRHEYSLENTYMHPTTGGRHCKACRLQYGRDYYAAHAERLLAQQKLRPSYRRGLARDRERYATDPLRRRGHRREA